MIRVLIRVRIWDRVGVTLQLGLLSRLGSIQVLRNAFFSGNWTTTHPPRNANNVEPYTFVTLLP